MAAKKKPRGSQGKNTKKSEAILAGTGDFGPAMGFDVFGGVRLKDRSKVSVVLSFRASLSPGQGQGNHLKISLEEIPIPPGNSVILNAMTGLALFYEAGNNPSMKAYTMVSYTSETNIAV